MVGDIDKNLLFYFLSRRNLNSLDQTDVTIGATYGVRVGVMFELLPGPRPGVLLCPETQNYFLFQV